jgi:hypothetical protein
MDPLRPGLNLRPDLLADGVTDAELRALRRRGGLVTLRPGAYLRGSPPDDAAARHLLAVRAALPKLGADVVVSQTSAAVVHGLPLWATRLERVHVTRNRASGGRCSGSVHLHVAALQPDEVTLVDGVPVTSVPRTLVDLGRSLSFEAALVPADAALFRGLATSDALAVAVDRAAHRPHNSAARRVVAFADGRAESPGETRSRVAIRRAGLPTPTLQYRVIGTRTDFAWEEFRTVGEFGQEGFSGARSSRAELDPFDAPPARLRRAFARG